MYVQHNIIVLSDISLLELQIFLYHTQHYPQLFIIYPTQDLTVLSNLLFMQIPRNNKPRYTLA